MKKQDINKLITKQSNQYAFLVIDRYYSSLSPQNFLIELTNDETSDAVSYKIVCELPFTQTFVKINLNVFQQYDEKNQTSKKTFYFLTNETVKNIFAR
jgi:hypothetical protein